MSDRRALICGYYGHGNGGDEALMVSVLAMLPPDVEPIVMSATPQQTKATYGVGTIDRKNALQAIEAMQASQYLILGGGSLLQDATSIQNPIYYGGLMGIAQQMGLKTIALAQGIGPLNRSLTKWIAKRAFGGCTAISVRDPASAFILGDWQMSCLMAPDPVWCLAATPLPQLQDLPTPRIAITLREHPQLTPVRLQALTIALAELQTATGAYILIVPFQPGSDETIAKTLQASLPGESQIIWRANPQELKGVFQGVDLAIGMRYHSLIMAAAEGCRTFAISYDPKVTQLMEDLEIPGWQLADIPTDAKAIAATWLDLWNDGTGLSSTTLADLTHRTNLHRELLLAAINGE
jgi:polysaccharide pyruvyl transferase CsaB